MSIITTVLYLQLCTVTYGITYKNIIVRGINTMPLIFNKADKVMERIVSACATLHEAYTPPWWCYGPWINVLVMLIKRIFSSKMPSRRDTIIVEGGGKC